MPEELEFQDLAAQYSEALLSRFYQEVYLPAFPIPDEREELDSWKDQLTIPRPPGAPETRIIIAGLGLKGGHPTLAGGTIVEYYPGSNLGLLTYLVVDPAFRGRNLSRILVDKQLNGADQAAEELAPGRRPYAYLSEMNDPNLPESQKDGQDPHQRWRILSKLGFCILDFPYVQPRLRGRARRYYGLKLLAHEHTWSRFQGGGEPTPDQEPDHQIRAGTLRNFLEEFYREVEGVLPDPAQDQDFAGMLEFLDRTPLVGVKSV